ncbi:MAG TPA: alkaline phosphatase family protein [Methylocystis sp.]|nr:alkaline phosphatase family protein [Methylocystis sp.]HXZ17807.1 alkaline phosphatase family protein [Roseiarcus sp.]
MKKLLSTVAIGALALAAAASAGPAAGASAIQHVLLISIDGMHAVDFYNCANGLPSINNGAAYCPQLAALAATGVTYSNASTSKPSDSFPGLTAIITGATPRTSGIYYDVSYDRKLSPPAVTTPYGIAGGQNLCPSVVGTQVGFDEEIDFNYLKLDAGGGINPQYLPRDPANACQPVYPHNWIRVNTIFEVVKAAGGYTAWSDKHPSYDFANGPSGKGVDDLWSPEINSIPVPLKGIAGCNPLPDPGAATSSNAWTDSFANIKCYDQLKVHALLNEIKGRNHAGAPAQVPNLFGMNFQAVSVGQKLVESSLSPTVTGGYVDAAGTPSAALLGEIQFVDAAIGSIVTDLKTQGLLGSTAIVITAKHGQSPIDRSRLLRIPHDDKSKAPPSSIVGANVAQADEDDISLLWLTDDSAGPLQTAVSQLQAAKTTIGADAGEIFYGPSLVLLFDDPHLDSRTPDIVVAPNVGVVYTGGGGKVAEHGGFAHDDTNVLLLISNPSLKQSLVTTPVATAQVAPTVLQLLGVSPSKLDAVQLEGTQPLPGVTKQY